MALPNLITRELGDKLDLSALHALHRERYPHLLESNVKIGSSQFNILFAFPGKSLTLHPDWSVTGPEVEKSRGFLGSFDRWWASLHHAPYQQKSQLPGIPFRGGWFLYAGYELSREIEPRLQRQSAKPNDQFPIAIATRFPAAVIQDSRTQEAILVAEYGCESLIDEMQRDINLLASRDSTASTPAMLLSIEEEPAEQYLESIQKVLKYIRDGDVFQVNLSRQWLAEFAQAPDDLYLFRLLREHNPGPFNGLATWSWGSIISSSPERLVRTIGELIETRPIAGTRPRGHQAAEDQTLSRELLRHPKERAEHIMLIDLERNDLGRVCVPGSVEVDELMALESYTHVHHIVSNVRGKIAHEVTPGQILAAVFPGGTITGCPKVRCMEIIAELEDQPRGPYTGSMGYVNRDGDMDMNILIRTMVRTGNCLRINAGGGIVADSDPGHELEETRAKAQGMLAALKANQDTTNDDKA